MMQAARNETREVYIQYMVCCQWRDEGCDSRATAAGGGHKNKATAKKSNKKVPTKFRAQKRFQAFIGTSDMRSDH